MTATVLRPFWSLASALLTLLTTRAFATLVITTAVSLSWTASIAWATPPGPASSTELQANAEVAVRFNDQTVFFVRAPRGDLSADARAKAAVQALKTAAAKTDPDDVRVELREDSAVVYAGETPIVTLTDDDASRAGDASVADHAAGIASAVRDAIQAEKKRSEIATTVFSFSLVVLLGLITLYLLRKTREFTRRARAWITTHPHRVPAIRLRSLEVIGPHALRNTLDLLLIAGRWIAQLGVIYAWLLVTLSMFESTRGYTQRLTGFVVSPVSELAARVAGSLPIVFIGLIAGAAVFVLVRFVGAFFDSAARGETELGWLARDLARPTGLLVRLGIVLVSLVILAPLVSGDPDGVLSRATMMTVVVLGLSAIPLCATALTGIVILFRRRVQVGEDVEIGGRAGKVLAVSLLDVRLLGALGYEERVPHLLSLWHPTRRHVAGARIEIELAHGNPAERRALSRTFLQAVREVGEDPSAEVVDIRDGTLVWRIAMRGSSELRPRLYEAILDSLGEPTPDSHEQAGAA